MKTKILAGWVLLALGAFPALAEVSGSVALTTDYVFRGISQTREDPAVQAAIDFTQGRFYLGVWGSNVDFGSDAQMELDVCGGLTGGQSDGLNWDLGLIYYAYPSESDLDFLEVYGGIGYKIFSAKLSYSDDFAATGGAGQYLEAGVDIPFGKSFTLIGHVGWSLFDDEVGLQDYMDYKAGFQLKTAQLTWELAYWTTDEKQLAQLDDDRVVATLSWP